MFGILKNSGVINDATNCLKGLETAGVAARL